MTEEEAFDLINRRRRQMHLHSILYYYLDRPLIDDATFDKWAVELAELNTAYPQFKHKGYWPSMFEDWTGDTGMHLTVTESMLWLAERLLKQADYRVG